VHLLSPPHAGMKFFTCRGGLDKVDIKALLEGAAGRAAGAALKLGECRFGWCAGGGGGGGDDRRVCVLAS
jgi:hypothetical protein